MTRRSAEAQAAVFHEADGIRAILRLSEALGQDAEPVKQAALGYVQFVLSEELPAMRQRGAVTDNLGKLRALGLALLAPSLAASASPAAQTAMLEFWLPCARQNALGLCPNLLAAANALALNDQHGAEQVAVIRVALVAIDVGNHLATKGPMSTGKGRNVHQQSSRPGLPPSIDAVR